MPNSINLVSKAFKSIHLQLFIVILVGLIAVINTFNTSRAEGVNYTTANSKIYANGSEVRFAGVNWFGFEDSNYMLHGLDRRPIGDMLNQMAEAGINAIRVPFCPGALKTYNSQKIASREKNPQLADKNALSALDSVLNDISNKGFYILLDHHRPDCNVISEFWYEGGYSENDWISDLKFVADRYKNLPKFMGLDLKNEPHGNAKWGVGGAGSDWKAAAERAGKAVLSVNSNILIFVEGISDGSNPCSYKDWANWGGGFSPYNCYPIDNSMIPANKLILSPHAYGPDVAPQPYFDDSMSKVRDVWEGNFGFLVNKGLAVVPGEYGSKYYPNSADRTWINKFTEYMGDKGICSSFYWSLNPDSGDTGGLLIDDWTSWNQDKLNMVKKYWNSCNTGKVQASQPVAPSPQPTPQPTPSPVVVAPTSQQQSSTPANLGNSNTSYTTQGGKLYENGSEIKLAGVNWFGAEESTTLVPHGLWARDYKSMITQMKSIGINAVRMPFCPSTISGAKTNSIDTKLNPDLGGKTPLEVFDMILSELNNQGVYILIDHHRPDCLAISNLWYEGSYSEEKWIEDLKFVANRYKGLPKFMGIDLKNEPHGNASWGKGDRSTDWNTAAERAGKAVASVNSNILIYVEGVGDNGQCEATEGKWWGGNLSPYKCNKIDYGSIPENKLVFSPHVYGPDVSNQSYFNDSSNLKNRMIPIWDSHFGFLIKEEGKAVVPGEFGGKYLLGSKDREWQNTIVDYFIDRGICSSFYWDWNPNSGDTGGILNDDWTTLNYGKVELLQRLWRGCSTSKIGSNSNPTTTVVIAPTPTYTPAPVVVTPAPSNPAPTNPTPTPTKPLPIPEPKPSAGTTDGSQNKPYLDPSQQDFYTRTVVPGVRASFNSTSNWGVGFCGDFSISNDNNFEIRDYKLLFKSKMIVSTHDWNGDVFHIYNENYQMYPTEWWNRKIDANQTITMGFCALTFDFKTVDAVWVVKQDATGISASQVSRPIDVANAPCVLPKKEEGYVQPFVAYLKDLANIN